MMQRVQPSGAWWTRSSCFGAAAADSTAHARGSSARRYVTAHKTPTALVIAALLMTLGACAPTLEGENQVTDANVLLTMQKDSGLAAQTWGAVDSYMENLVGDRTGPGCAVGIARRGELVYLQGYGRAVVGGQICSGDECVPLGGAPWTVGTVGAVGSVSKTFTAAAALRMHELGMLDVNQTVGSYLSTGNPKLAAARIYALLNHSSGVGGANQSAAFSPTWASTASDCLWSNDAFCQAFNRMLARPAWAFLWYQADEDVADLANGDPSQGVYSNVGYSVAGAIIDEVATGTSSGGYEAWIWNNVGLYTGNLLSADNLLSLALTHSWRAEDIPYRAVGYTPNGNGFDVLEAWEGTGGLEGWQGPAGGWAMTIGDLTRFAVALNTEQIVGNAMLAAMRYRWTDLDGFSNDYGMGTFLGDGNEPPYWHGGLIGGHTAVWTWWDSYAQTGQSLGIAIICNRSDIGPFPLRDHARNIALQSWASDPQPRRSQMLRGVGARSIGRRVFALDEAGAWQVEPKGAFVPLAALSHTPLLHVETRGHGLSLQLSQAAVRRGEVAQATKPQPLGVTDFSADPWFTTAPTAVTLATAIGDVEITDFVVEGAFDDRATALTRVALTGLLDARQAQKLLGWDYRAVCADVASAGARCEPCDDGVAACVTVRYEGLGGNRVPGPLR